MVNKISTVYDELSFNRSTRHPQSLMPEFVEQFHKRIVNHECDSHVQAHSTQSGHSSFVESVKFKTYIKKFLTGNPQDTRIKRKNSVNIMWNSLNCS